MQLKSCGSNKLMQTTPRIDTSNYCSSQHQFWCSMKKMVLKSKSNLSPGKFGRRTKILCAIWGVRKEKKRKYPSIHFLSFIHLRVMGRGLHGWHWWHNTNLSMYTEPFTIVLFVFHAAKVMFSRDVFSEPAQFSIVGIAGNGMTFHLERISTENGQKSVI